MLLSPTPEVKTPDLKPALPVPKADWEQKWESALAEAKKEGAVSIYNIWRPETRVVLTPAFKEKYGINLEFTPFSRGSDLLVRTQTEKRAGLHIVDVFGAGNSTLVVTMKAEGLLSPIKPLLILPEVLDSNAWQGGKLPFSDKEGTALSMIGTVIRTVVYNTNLIKEGEITSYMDLLRPQYKGKITLNDPGVTGAGFSVFVHLGRNLWGEEKTVDFLRRLIKEQEIAIQRDNRIHIESVARGKYAIGLGPLPDLLAEFFEAGAPIKFALVKEDNRITAAAGAFGIPTKFANPNGTTVFINWLLTKEGQSVFAKGWGNPSTRVDASTEGIDPVFIPIPGEKYYMETEEFLAARTKWLEITPKIVREATK